MATDLETVVVGAGVVGLAIARALARRGQSVTVLERNGGIGAEVSSRSSEVIHAGLYYPPGSLRGRLCVAGREMLYRFAADNGVAVRRCGKLLVATSPDELPALEAIAQTAVANGVTDVRRLSGEETRALEPELAAAAALLSPSTGVIDSHGLLQALEGSLASLGGEVVLRSGVERIACNPAGHFTLHVSTGAGEAKLSARLVVLAPGLGGSALAASVDWPHGYTPPRTYPAKGHYYVLSGRQPFSHLVYPMPQGAWLGVHLTLDVAGRAKFGPDCDWQKTADYRFEDECGARRRRFEREIRRYWPGLPDDALQPGYTGVRPKIYPQDAPVADFAIHGTREHGVANLVALYGIESPGLTASLAIAEHVAQRLAGA
jgi:L-2-hydroxyglutarate oxidase LhgO